MLNFIITNFILSLVMVYSLYRTLSLKSSRMDDDST